MEEQAEIVTAHVVQFCSLGRILAFLQTYPDEYHSSSGDSKKPLLPWTRLQVLLRTVPPVIAFHF